MLSVSLRMCVRVYVCVDVRVWVCICGVNRMEELKKICTVDANAASRQITVSDNKQSDDVSQRLTRQIIVSCVLAKNCNVHHDSQYWGKSTTHTTVPLHRTPLPLSLLLLQLIQLQWRCYCYWCIKRFNLLRRYGAIWHPFINEFNW